MKRKINGISYVSMLLLGIYITVYQSAIGTIAKEYDLNDTAVGIIISLHFIGSVLAPVAFGEISDRVGKKAVVILAFCLFVLGLSGVYLAQGIFIIALGIFLIGCGFAVIEGTLSGVLAEVNPEKTGRVMNFSQMFFSIGAVVGPLIFIFMTDRFKGWRGIFLAMLLAFVTVTIYMFQLQLGGVKRRPANDKGLISLVLLKEKIFLLLCISMFAYVGIEEGIAFWLGSYFENNFDSTSLGAYTLSGYWGSMIIGRYLAGRFHDKYPLFLKWGLLISLISIIIALIVKINLLTAICFLFTGFGLSAVWPIIMSIAADRYPQYNGTAMGIMMTCGAGGGTAIPLLTGIISGYTGVETAFWIIPMIIIVVIILLSRVTTMIGN